MPHMEGIFINGEKAKFHPEDILDTNASQYTEEIGTATKEWLSENLTPESAGVVDKTLSIEGAAADAKETGNRISELKNTLSDLQSDGVAPSAEQLLSKNMTADAVPYLFRPTGGNGADREYVDAIVGGTVNWNQFANNANTPTDRSGITFTNDGNSFTMNGTSTGVSAAGWFGIADSSHFSGHVVLSEIRLITGSVSGGNSAIRFAAVASNNDACQLNSPKIVKYGNLTASCRSSFAVDPECVCDNAKCRVQVFDLTAMFGTKIADYIYSLEQANAGAGVAFFKSLFPNDYYPYNAGELVSVSGLSEHKMVGFNQFDGELEFGNINSSGVNDGTSKNYVRSKNYLRGFPNTTYCFTSRANQGFLQLYVLSYRADKSLISRNAFRSFSAVTYQDSATFTTSADCAYVRFFYYKSPVYSVTDGFDACINFSDPTKNGQYELYKAHSYPLDSSLTLRGLFKLDANNQLYADGDTYDADGTVTRKYGVVDLGTLRWHYDSTANPANFVAALPNAGFNRPYWVRNALLSSGAYTLGENVGQNGNDKKYGIAGTVIHIADSSYTDTAAFKTAMSGEMLVYELATPTTEEADSYQHLQQCDPNGTEEFVSTGIVPVGHETRYPENLRAKIEGLPWDFSSIIAPTEATFTATRNYTAGSLLIMGNTLYKVTANIANGGTITPNTNVTATTLSEYESIFTGDVDESVQNWLDVHPEATTTVQDGSITREKFTELLNKRIKSLYDTAEDMIHDTSLVSGMFAQTGGNESVYDGGGQLYRITSTKPSAQSSAEVPAEVYETLTNGLYAERVLSLKETKFSIEDKIGNSYCGNFINNASVISELLDVCSSYEDNGDKLYYGHYSALDYGDHDVSNGEDNGKYQIDCSAFVQLALAGIAFDSSRYNVDDNYFVSQYSFFPYRTKAEYQNQNTWAKYRLSDCQAKYAYENGYAFLPNWDWSNVQAGDVVYLQDGNTESSNWGGVDHVMIYIGRRNKTDDLTFYECGGNSGHRTSVSSSNLVHVRTSTLAFMNANTKLIARYPLGVGDSNANCVIYEDKHPDFPVTFSAGARSAVYEIEPISTGEWYTVIAKVKSLNSHPFYITDAGHQMAYPAIDSSAIFVNTFRATADFHAFRIGSYESTDGDIVFEDFKIVKGFGNSLNVPYKKPTRVKKVDAITVNYQNATANAWEYVGLSITVPAGHRYLVRCTQGWNSGKPIGMALHTATSGTLTYTHESANDAVMGTPTYMLDSGTWYLFTKRATVATSTNVYAVTILDVDLS